MNPEEKQYTNGEVTLVWKPDVCIHSARCWKGLIAVFNPKKGHGFQWMVLLQK
jgi:uncharacterized Fe-S cluster protein YjdI